MRRQLGAWLRCVPPTIALGGVDQKDHRGSRQLAMLCAAGLN
jgi:hypothetical protein